MTQRIQYKRGVKLPLNTVYVGRPSRWGNPYKIPPYAREDALDLYETWLQNQIKVNSLFLYSLRGKDLACWCSIEDKCHADILLAYLEMGL